MNEIKVSVIIPVYNASHILSKTLDSVTSQNFKDFEIIIVDDGSTDDSLEKSFEILSKRTIPHQIIHQKNKGVSIARNNGLEIARGKYILFVDDDDCIDKNHIKYLYDSIKENNTDYAFSKLAKINDKEKIIFKNNYNELKNKKTISTLDLIKIDLKMKIPFSFIEILYDVSILKENNIKFEKDYKYGEDIDFALKALFSAKTISIVDKTTYFYRKYENSASSKLGLNRFQLIAIYDNLTNYFKNNNKHFSKDEINDLEKLIKYNRIPKAIFGNLMYLFFNDYDIGDILNEMERLNLFSKLSMFKIAIFNDILFLFKSKLFLANPSIYYKLWKTFKNSINGEK